MEWLAVFNLKNRLCTTWKISSLLFPYARRGPRTMRPAQIITSSVLKTDFSKELKSLSRHLWHQAKKAKHASFCNTREHFLRYVLSMVALGAVQTRFRQTHARSHVHMFSHTRVLIFFSHARDGKVLNAGVSRICLRLRSPRISARRVRDTSCAGTSGRRREELVRVCTV